ncbi:MAG: acetolactate synthase small subunit [Sporomusaceae bacterium]|nr:acetolactate synthase small subunit [Sporomusaceae bacterium]
MKNVLSVLVQNQPGVLVRVASMFARRGFNIDSLAVGPTQRPEYSRITAVVAGNQLVVDQVVKQLKKLIEVVAVQVLPPESVARGLALIKINASEQRSEILKLAEVFRASVVDVDTQVLTLEITGDEAKIDALATVLAPFGVVEMVRTGLIGLARSNNTIYQSEENDEYEQNVL